MKKLLALFILLSCNCFAVERLVSVVPAITEVVYALGAGDQLVGVSTFCKYPKEATTKPKVGTPFTPNLEEIVKLKPKLVLSQKMRDTKFKKDIEKLNIPIKEFSLNTFEDLKMAIKDIAEVVGKDDNKISKNLLENEKKLASLKLKGSFLAVISEEVHSNALVGLMAAGSGTYLDQVISLSGLDNWFGKINGYKVVSIESLVNKPPNYIFLFNKKKFDTSIFQTSKVKKLNGEWALIPGPRVNLFMDELYIVLNPKK